MYRGTSQGIGVKSAARYSARLTAWIASIALDSMGRAADTACRRNTAHVHVG